MFSDQLDDFNARVKRISDPRNTSYRDPETGLQIPKRISKAEILRANLARKPHLMGMVLAALVGAICLMTARYLRWHYLDMSDLGGEVDANLVTDLIIAAGVAIVLGSILRQKTWRHMTAQMAGIGIMVVAMHNLVWMYPEPFAQVYSQAWVDMVQQTTTPQSLALRGAVYTL